MGDAKLLRKRLFARYAGNLRVIDPSSAGAFRCPLCLKDFTAKDVHSKLCLAHIFPQGAGGSEVTLACQSCDSLHGSSLDADLVESVRVERPGSKQRGRIVAGGRSIPILVSADPDDETIRLDASIRHAHPTDWTGIQDFFAAAGDGSKFQLSVTSKVRPTRMRGSLYRSAYLRLFSMFGYDYVLAPCAQVARENIERAALGEVSVTVCSSDARAESVAIVTAPTALRSLAVTMKVSGQRFATALLPGFDRDPRAVADRMCESPRIVKGVQTKVFEAPPDVFADPKNARLLSGIWRLLFKTG